MRKMLTMISQGKELCIDLNEVSYVEEPHEVKESQGLFKKKFSTWVIRFQVGGVLGSVKFYDYALAKSYYEHISGKIS